MVIKETEYNGNVFDSDGVLVCSMPVELSLAELQSIMDATRVEDGEVVYNIASFRSCKLDNGTEIRYYLVNETAALQTELEEKNAKLTAITEAITALGSGIPTLAKLKDFLNAVKEAVGYGTDN